MEKPDPFANHTPRKNKPPAQQSADTAIPSPLPLSGLSLDEVNKRLAGMTREQLETLVRLSNSVLGGILLATREERREAATLKLWQSGMNEKEIYKALPALNAAMDREFGKPAQSIALAVKDEGLSKVSTERLLRLAAMMDEKTIDNQ
jgi:hypothetical protein